jgi:hypothetical protein
MPKQPTDNLIFLIRSLTKAEKRHFRLLAQRSQATSDQLYLQLFDAIDRTASYQEDQILKRIPEIKPRQLSNLKAALYQKLLTSLRQQHLKSHPEMAVREDLDFARVLYDKGLYRAALDRLERAKRKALKSEQLTLALQAIDFEKLIEGQYITRSVQSRAEALSAEADAVYLRIDQVRQFSNLSLELYGLYLRIGYVRNSRDYEYVQSFFEERLPKTPASDLTFFGRVYYHQAHVWYHYIQQDFAQCYRHAQHWVDLFSSREEMIQLEAPLYLKGLHALLNALFNVMRDEQFDLALEQLKKFPEQFPVDTNHNVKGLYLLFLHIHQMKQHFLKGSFSEGLALVPDLKHVMSKNPYNWDERRIMIFHYRIACMHFGAGEFGPTVDVLGEIINQPVVHYREDIQCFARILSLISHFELGNNQLVEYQIKSVVRFLLRMREMHDALRVILDFLRRLPDIQPNQLNKAFRQLRNRLQALEQESFERRPFLYLDIISWLDSKLEKKPVQCIIQQKHQVRILKK